MISLDWLGNSPNSNPIENVLGEMADKVRIRRPRTMAELKETIEKVWYEEITAEYLSAFTIPSPKGEDFQ